MKGSLFVASALALTLVTAACTQAGRTELTRGIEVTGEGRIQFSHNAVRLVVIAGGRGATPEAAALVAGRNFDAMTASLSKAGVLAGDMVSSDLALHSLGEAGYTAGRRMVVVLRNLGGAARVLSDLAAAVPEARYCSWDQFRFVVTGDDLSDKARQAAMADARAQAASVADAAGVRVGKVLSVRETANVDPSTPGMTRPPFGEAGARSIELVLSQPRLPVSESLVTLVVRFEIEE